MRIVHGMAMPRSPRARTLQSCVISVSIVSFFATAAGAAVNTADCPAGGAFQRTWTCPLNPTGSYHKCSRQCEIHGSVDPLTFVDDLTKPQYALDSHKMRICGGFDTRASTSDGHAWCVAERIYYYFAHLSIFIHCSANVCNARVVASGIERMCPLHAAATYTANMHERDTHGVIGV